MALFRKKQPEPDGERDETRDGESPSSFTPQPEKAKMWFEHARTAAMSSNYGYALRLYANGIRLDPGLLSAHESMWEAAVRYLNQNGKPASGRDVRAVDDGTPAGRFAAAELEWMTNVRNLKAAMKTLEMATKAEQLEVGNRFAGHVAGLLKSQKKLSKGVLLQAMEVFRAVGAWDESMMAGQMAYQLDPADSGLDAELKNLSAQRAMDQGGYDAAGEEGGFQKFIRDADTQQQLIEEESLAANASTDERNLQRARRAYEQSPGDPDSINRYAQLLKKRGDPESEDQALAVYEKGFQDTGEYRFRMSAGDLRIERLQRRVRELEAQLEGQPEQPEVASERDRLRTEVLELRTVEYAERVKKYPTDRFRKYELGTVQFERGQYREAMEQFQPAKEEPKLRVRAGHMLGRCFQAEAWYAEAISEFDESLQAIDATERGRELMIRYDLMVGLLAAARQEKDLDLARRAREICSEIARKDITYRDIRDKRAEADTVIRELSADH